MLTWMYECAPEEERNVVDQASRIVVTNFAAIHTSGIVSPFTLDGSNMEANVFSW
jgi:hypothetical protein